MECTGDITECVTEIKRLYSDLNVWVYCPNCGFYNGDDYLSYVQPGIKDYIVSWCDACDCEFQVPFVFKGAYMNIEFFEDEIKEY